MKILYFDYDDLKNPYANGGQAYTTDELVNRLAKKHAITVVTGKYPDAFDKKKGNIIYKRLGSGQFGFMVSLVSYWLLIPFYIALKQNNFDLIIECLTAPFVASFAPLLARKPLIAVVHFFDSKKLSEKYHLPLHVFQKLLGKYKHFIVLTDELRGKIRKFNQKATVAVIPGGVDEALLKSRIQPGDYMLYLGRIDIYNKCLDVLLESWKGIDEKLIMAGSGKKGEIDKLKSLIKKHGLWEKVKFVGRVSGDKKIDLFSKSKFVVQPSRYETFGYVALETLASGKLLVCFDIDGFKWIPNKSAIKVKGFSTRSLVSGINTALRSQSLRKKAQKINRKFARNFKWDLIAKQYEAELRKVI